MNIPRSRLMISITVILTILFSIIIYFESTENIETSKIRFSFSETQNNKNAEPPLITYFLIDGFGHVTFNKLLEQGKLPNMKKLAETGGFVKNGITTFPSITGYAFYPMLTGVSAPLSNVYALRFFDRNRTENNFRAYVGTPSKYMNEDVNPNYKLLFEEFSDDYTYTANCYMNRGVDNSYQTPWFMATAKYGPYKWYFRLAKLFGSFGYRDWMGFESNVMDNVIKEAINNRPKVQWVVMASPDGSHHVIGFDDLYDDVVINVDKQIGRFVDAMEKDGSLKDRLIIVLSDHGSINTYNNLDLYYIFGQMNMKVYETGSLNISPIHFTTNVNWYSKNDYDVVAAINGNAVVYIYFSNPEMRNDNKDGADWQHRLLPQHLVDYTNLKGEKINLWESLRCQAGLEFMIGLSIHFHNSFIIDPNSNNYVTEIRDCYSSAIVHRNGDTWAYVVIESDKTHSDPFKYLSDPNVPQRIRDAVNNGEYLTRREWLELTLQGEYPLGPVLIEEITSMPTCGDFIFTAKSGYDFAKDYEWFLYNNRGGHGGIHRNQTLIPMIFNGWGVKPGTQVEYATSTDVGATVRHIAGLPHVPGSAGVELLDLLDHEKIQSLHSE